MENFQLSEKNLLEIEARLKEGKSKLEELITTYPITSVVSAFLLGYIISKTLNSKD